ncbi:hypothetical protein FVC46_02150 [Salmonella enterica]|nr:hypothetical protein [Salmonella enterica]
MKALTYHGPHHVKVENVYSAANYLIPICILFDTDKKQTTANYLIPNPPLFDGF